MNREEIFQRLYALRLRIEAGAELPMLDSQNCLLYDIANELDLTERQAQMLAGDIRPDQPTKRLTGGVPASE